MKIRVSCINSRGFTLVELAIVLVIIGLIVAGVLKGRELIGGAKSKNVVNQIKAYEAAVTTYQDKNKAVPGDGSNSGTLDGAITAAEIYGVAGALASANLITGSYTSDTTTNALMKHKLGGFMYMQTLTSSSPLVYPTGYSNVTGKPGNAIIVTDLPLETAKSVDDAMDDGQLGSGSFVGFGNYSTNPTVNVGFIF